MKRQVACERQHPHTLPKGSFAISQSSDLGDDFEPYLAELVASGRYPSRDEALRDGIRLIQQREKTIAALRLRYLQSVTAADRGDLEGAAQILSELRTNIIAMKVGRDSKN